MIWIIVSVVVVIVVLVLFCVRMAGLVGSIGREP